MGFGCNAAGVVACRIISSPRERIIAVLTNAFIPCNGRIPTLIAIITMFFAVGGTQYESIFSTLILTGVIVFAVLLSLAVSKLLSLTLLKGEKSAVTLELPPYRKPKIFSLIVRSIFDKTLKLLKRAVVVSIPAGLVLYLLANITIGDVSILTHLTEFLDPFARLMGLDGVILLAFILGFPANEIVVPIIIMSYMKMGYMIELEELAELKALLIANGWTIKTAICTMLFSLAHFPCGTTMLTINKEIGSKKWTAISFLLPTVLGIILCILVNLIFSLI